VARRHLRPAEGRRAAVQLAAVPAAGVPVRRARLRIAVPPGSDRADDPALDAEERERARLAARADRPGRDPAPDPAASAPAAGALTACGRGVRPSCHGPAHREIEPCPPLSVLYGKTRSTCSGSRRSTTSGS